MNTFNKEPYVYHTFGDRGKTIILYHGWGSSIRTYIEFAEEIAGLGFRVVLPELPFHDSRNRLESHFRQDITQQFFWKTIFQSIDEAPQLFEVLDVPIDEIILLGSSMGGFIASGIAANYPEVAGLLCVNSSGSFLTSERIFRNKDGRPELSAEETSVFNAYNPVERKSTPSSVLLLHGIHDNIISIEGQMVYETFLKTQGADVTFLTYEDVNHTITDILIDDIKQWLIQQFRSETMNNLTKSPVKNRIGGIFIPVRDLDRAREWYGRVLGLVEGEVFFGHIFVPEMEGSAQLIMDTMPRWRNEAGDIYPYHAPSLQFITEDIQASFEFMKSQEVELLTEIEDNFYFVIRDLDGNLLMICEER